MNSLKYIFSFLSTIPVPGSNKLDFTKPGNSMYLFFLVGVVFSVIISVFNLVFSYFFSETVLAVISIVVVVLLTGGLHLDGLADSFDGLAGYAPQKRYKIMKDSFIGSFGVIAIVLVLLLKIFLIRELLLLNISAFMFTAVSRAILPIVIYKNPVISEDGISYIFKKNIELKHVSLNLAVIIFFIIVIEGLVFLIPFIATLVFSMILSSFFNGKLNGVNGDVYGAVIELNEVVYLIISVFILGII